ncbi:hypothetical protein QJS04_geneDACA003640 [Acorus gramineus]|uniref:Uncharacterized protein n=1 Tax=Acorus gramineus TaxID=55184 RepID=A0AAV9BMX3_ACOGR|nr:hypothetical protein QJS04_geneDACA003640 [Acorus gramineus]
MYRKYKLYIKPNQALLFLFKTHMKSPASASLPRKASGSAASNSSKNTSHSVSLRSSNDTLLKLERLTPSLARLQIISNVLCPSSAPRNSRVIMDPISARQSPARAARLRKTVQTIMTRSDASRSAGCWDRRRSASLNGSSALMYSASDSEKGTVA